MKCERFLLCPWDQTAFVLQSLPETEGEQSDKKSIYNFLCLQPVVCCPEYPGLRQKSTFTRKGRVLRKGWVVKQCPNFTTGTDMNKIKIFIKLLRWTLSYPNSPPTLCQPTTCCQWHWYCSSGLGWHQQCSESGRWEEPLRPDSGRGRGSALTLALPPLQPHNMQLQQTPGANNISAGLFLKVKWNYFKDLRKNDCTD